MIQPNTSKRSCGPPQAMPDDTWDLATVAAFLDLLARLIARQHVRSHRVLLNPNTTSPHAGIISQKEIK